MEIVKQLNLNKTPQSVPNGSLIFAKNIMLGKDFSYITNEDGLLEANATRFGGTVIGIIPCVKELVVFCSAPQVDVQTGLIVRRGFVYRCVEQENSDYLTVTQVTTNWKPSRNEQEVYTGVDTKVTGAYTYNVNNELILTIGEYPVNDSDYQNYNIPLKTANFGVQGTTNVTFYPVSSTVPVANLYKKKFALGVTIPCGIYHFFIRYELDVDKYSTWFPIGVPYYALSARNETLINHKYTNALSSVVSISKLIHNPQRDASYSFNFNLKVYNVEKEINCQIGYILQKDDGAVGRLNAKYKLTPDANNESLVNFTFRPTSVLEEVDVNEFLDNSFSLYNVKNVTNYENRVYIANYKETNYNEYDAKLKAIADAISASVDRILVSDYYGTKREEYDTAIRSFMPSEVYQFYVHFVRRDGSYTNGYFVERVPMSNHSGTMYKLSVRFDNINFDGTNGIKALNYVGCFFTYEKTNHIVNFMGLCVGPSNVLDNCVYADDSDETIAEACSDQYTSSSIYQDSAIFKANDVETTAVSFNSVQYMPLYTIDSDGNIAADLYDGGWRTVTKVQILASNTVISYPGNGTSVIPKASSLGQHGGIQVVINGYSFKNKEVGIFRCIADNDSSGINDIFSREDKELISLGPILTKADVYKAETDSDGYNNYFEFNLPGFICWDDILVYVIPIVIKDEDGYAYPYKKLTTGTYTISENKLAVDHDYAKSVSLYKYSLINLNALSFKKESDIIAGIGAMTGQAHTDNAAANMTTYNVIYPQNLTDLYKIESDYIDKHYKLYTNYSNKITYIATKTGTIRRSEPIRDESTENSWMIFRPNQYKEIDKNKGRITNVVGTGVYLLVHTEHSIFMFDKTSILKTEDTNVQLSTPDVFDAPYQEILTGNHGYGGMQKFYNWCLNHHGYWFYDKDDLKLYRFDAGQLIDLTQDIVKVLDYYKFVECRLGTDFENNRVLFSFRTSDDKYLTLSYDYNVNKFISIHDYYFTEIYNTKNRIYLFAGSNVLFTFGGAIGNYEGLCLPGTNGNLNNYPSYNRTTDGVKYNYSYVDIIFNFAYETSKVLEFISYILNKINSFLSDDVDRQAEENLDSSTNNDVTHYSGDMLQIYTDVCNTGLLNINVSGNVNQLNEYKYPYFHNGVWNFNYFRNRITTALTDSELNDIASKLNVPVARLKDGLIVVTDSGGNNVYRYSDYRQLIYGKYFVIRFIFNPDSNNKHIKLENVDINVNKY